MMQNLNIIFLLITLSYFVHSCGYFPTQKWIEAGLIPSVVNCAPKYCLEVVYKCNVRVNHGCELTPKQVKDRPVYVSWYTEPYALYTLIMIDPDAPSRKMPLMGQIIHWMVVNIPGSDIYKGETKLEYMGPAPPKLTGKHRYTFLVFKQKKRLCNLRKPKRIGFNVQQFAKKHCLGRPVAGNFFQSKFDHSVIMQSLNMVQRLIKDMF